MDSRDAAQLQDIKTMFDGVKNLALCVAVPLGLQGFQSPMETIGLSYQARASFNTVGIILAIFLTAFATVWLCYSFIERPASELLFKACRFMLGAITLAAMVIIIGAESMSIPHWLWSIWT